MGLSAFNAMRARQKAKEAAEKKDESLDDKIVSFNDSEEQKPKKTDAEKLKNKKKD